MESIKLSVTAKKNLERKYSAAARREIDKAVKAWIAGDATHGIKTIHVALDDDQAMNTLGVPPLKGRATANKVKRAVDALWKRISPDYLVLFGGEEIIPHFVVDNPSFHADGDDDAHVPTDNPYASSSAYRKSRRDSYLVPDRAVGRIPDMVEDGDPAWLVDYLAVASNWASEPRSAYRGAFAVCCDAWKGAGKESVRYFGEPDSRLLVSPPESDSSSKTKTRLKSRLHMIKCHGAQLDPRFFGQKGASYPVVLTSKTLRQRLKPRTVAAAMCCYGAQVYSPDDPAAQEPGAWPLASSYLRGGAWGFVGSTMIAWVGGPTMMCADWVVAAYLNGVLGGASLGRAMLEAKQDYVRWIGQQGHVPDIADEKTLIEFVLLGDPSIHPVSSAVAVAASPVRSRAVAAARPSALASQERRQRRVFRAGLADQIRDMLPQRDAAPKAAEDRASHVFAAVRAAMGKENPQAFGIKPKQAWVNVVESPTTAAAPLRAGLARAAMGATPLEPRRSLEYYWTGRRVQDGHKQIRLIKVETDAEGQVVRCSVVLSS